MNRIIVHSLRFFAFAFAQVLLFNQIEPGLGIHLMIYPLFIFLLPLSLKPIPGLFIVTALGLIVDIYSNTYGLHASASLVLWYVRPLIFALFQPKDEYEGVEEVNIYVMESRWTLLVYFTLLLVHHLWFFSLEMFKWNELDLIIQKTLLSVPLNFLLFLFIQLLFLRKPKS